MGATDEISKQLLDEIEELANLEPYFEILKSSSFIIFDPLIKIKVFLNIKNGVNKLQYPIFCQYIFIMQIFQNNT